MVVLDWNQSFSLQGNVIAPGYQRMVLSGMITDRRADGLYAAPLLPQLFYGASGNQLSTWRQNITQTGNVTLLSRSGGKPSIPKDQLAWRKVAEVPEPYRTEEAAKPRLTLPPMLPITLGLMGAFIAAVFALGRKKD